MTKSELIERVAQHQTQLALGISSWLLRRYWSSWRSASLEGSVLRFGDLGVFLCTTDPDGSGAIQRPVIRFLCLKNTFHTLSQVKSCANALTRLIAIPGHKVSYWRFCVSTGSRESAGARVVNVFGSYDSLRPRTRGLRRRPFAVEETQLGGNEGVEMSDLHCRPARGLEQCSSKVLAGLTPTARH